MESISATPIDRPDSLTIRKNYHTIYEHCRKNHVRHVHAELDITHLSDVAKSRIRDFYLKGVISPGTGFDLVHLLQPEKNPLSYIFVDSYTRPIPVVGRKLRPHSLTLYHDTSTNMTRHLADYNVADIARWKLMAEGKPVGAAVSEGVRERYVREGCKMLYLSGLQTKADLVKHFAPLIIQGERKARGEELYARFQSLKTLVLET